MVRLGQRPVRSGPLGRGLLLLGALLALMLIGPGRAAAASGGATATRHDPVPVGLRETPPEDSASPAEASIGAELGLPWADTYFGPFAGEIDFGAPHSVSAVWNVPRVKPGSNTGFAGTWIGVQAPGDSASAPFIQVGINEERVRDPETGRSENFYYAFWTDTHRGFRPVFLGDVEPGDEIYASLVLHDGRWTVSLENDNWQGAVHFTTREEGAGHFNLAEFLQEDVTNGETGRPFRYPELTGLTFNLLRINGAVPAFDANLDTQWMNEHGRFLGPLAESPAGFVLGAETLSSQAIAYLRTIEPYDTTVDWFGRVLETWRPSTSPITIAAERSEMTRAFQQVDSQLSTVSWPVQVQGPVADLISANEQTVAYLQTTPTMTTAGLKRWLAGWEDIPYGDAFHQVRQWLDLPEYDLAYNG